MKHKDESVELLKDILITQLGSSGVQQQVIRKIIGCDIGRVNRIVKYLKPKKSKQGQEKDK